MADAEDLASEVSIVRAENGHLCSLAHEEDADYTTGTSHTKDSSFHAGKFTLEITMPCSSSCDMYPAFDIKKRDDSPEETNEKYP